MTIEVLGFLHAGIRIGPTEEDAARAKAFYQDLLGLATDGERPYIEGIPGFWSNINGAGDRSHQVHVMGAEGESPVARSAKEDPTRAHVAFSVADLEAAKEENASLKTNMEQLTAELEDNRELLTAAQTQVTELRWLEVHMSEPDQKALEPRSR